MSEQAETVRYVVGTMTGTSIDGLDVALMRITGRGLTMRAQLVGFVAVGLGALASPLRQLAEQQPLTAGEICKLGADFAALHIRAIGQVLTQSGVPRPDLIAIHGQTVFHQPPLSWQFFCPASVARAFDAPVVFDLRAADLAAGGQGAPITPLADLVLFGADYGPISIVNLGGFGNFTSLPADGDAAAISGGDLCACNHVLDAVARAALGKVFDVDGAAAMAGVASASAMGELAEMLGRQGESGRSLGTGDEVASWAARTVAQAQGETPGEKGAGFGANLCAAACAAVAETIVKGMQQRGCGGRLALFGGGARNAGLVRELHVRWPAKVLLGPELGMPVEAREAACMGVLGALCQDGVAITLPQVTLLPPGVPSPVAGLWAYPPRNDERPEARGVN